MVYSNFRLPVMCMLIVALPQLVTAQNIGMGTTTPAAKLHIFNGASAVAGPFGPVIIENNNNSYLNFLAPDASESGILFGKGTNAAHGGIVYNSVATPNGLQFRTNLNQTRMTLSNNGYLGIGTNSAATRLDVAGLNNWDLTNTEGDVRIGNSSYRLKIGVATGGGGAGGVGIMQYGLNGGYNVLTLGAQGNGILHLNGGTGRSGIGTDNPLANLEIRSSNGSVNPQLWVRQTNTNDYSRIRLNNNAGTSNYWDIATYHGAAATDDRLNFFNGRNGSQLGLNGNAAIMLSNNAGSPGQVLKSNGGGASNSWVSPTNTLFSGTAMLNASGELLSNTFTPALIPGLSANFSTAGNAKILVHWNIEASTNICAFCGTTFAWIDIVLNGNMISRVSYEMPNGTTTLLSGSHLATVAAGNHNLQVRASRSGPDMKFAVCCTYPNSLIYQVIPE